MRIIKPRLCSKNTTKVADTEAKRGRKKIPSKLQSKAAKMTAKAPMKVLFFIFAVSLAIGVLVAKFGDKGMEHVFFAGTFFQPLIAVVVGLIPNCAASVAITEVYLKGGITFGSAIAGTVNSRY